MNQCVCVSAPTFTCSAMNTKSKILFKSSFESSWWDQECVAASKKIAWSITGSQRKVKTDHRCPNFPKCSGAHESNCCSSVSVSSCGVKISVKAGLVSLKMTRQPNIIFFGLKKKLSLSTCGPIQWRAWIKLLQLRECVELRRQDFREGGPCGSKNDPAAKYFFL